MDNGRHESFYLLEWKPSRKHSLVLRLKTVQSLHHPCPYVVDDGNIVNTLSKIKLTFLEKNKLCYFDKIRKMTIVQVKICSNEDFCDLSNVKFSILQSLLSCFSKLQF